MSGISRRTFGLGALSAAFAAVWPWRRGILSRAQVGDKLDCRAACPPDMASLRNWVGTVIDRPLFGLPARTAIIDNVWWKVGDRDVSVRIRVLGPRGYAHTALILSESGERQLFDIRPLNRFDDVEFIPCAA